MISKTQREIVDQKIVELYQKGIKIKKIMEVVHFSDTYIRKVLKREDVFVYSSIQANGIQIEIEKLIRSGRKKSDIAKEIASKTDFKEKTLLNYCRKIEKKLGWEKLQKYKYFRHKSRKGHARSLYEQGTPVTMIARITGISRGILYRNIRKHNWKRFVHLSERSSKSMKCSVCGERLGSSTVRYVGYDADADKYYSEYVCSAFCLEEIESDE